MSVLEVASGILRGADLNEHLRSGTTVADDAHDEGEPSVSVCKSAAWQFGSLAKADRLVDHE